MRNWHLCLILILFCSVSNGATTAGVETNGERRVAFNDGWRFAKGDATGAELPGFVDTGWRELNLPHDWAIEGPFDKKYSPQSGGLPFYGVAWYRKHFGLPAAGRGRHYSIEFDGAMSNSHVWLNGKELGSRPYGYIGFAFDMTPFLKFGGEENVLAVRLAPENKSSRWYPGAGIYRNVWMDVTGPVQVARWGTYVTTPEVSSEKAAVAIRTEIQNHGAVEARMTLETTILDQNGKQVASNSTGVNVPPDAKRSVDEKIAVTDPQRWDVDRPYLYQAESTLKDGPRVIDCYVTWFGIRTIEFDRNKGFVLNGRSLKMNGVCLHHDLGALGAAVNRRATERQLQIMKAMGANAIRTSHNPPSPELLELCDKLGLVVMDEAFDMWRLPKLPNGHGKYFDQWGETDIRDMVRRDRNHPSIVLWSIGNEIREQGVADGWKVAKFLTGIVHREDPTRPVTAGFDNWEQAIKNGLAEQVDIPGFNYKPAKYRRILEEHPKWIIVASETSSCVSSRGVYHLPIEKYERHPSLQLTSYDVIAPPWAMAPDVEFDAQEKIPGILGEFVWTGFDYLGEPTPFGAHGGSDWPSRSSYFGIVDLAGFPKDRYYLYQSQWSKEPMVHLLPHWNWAGREGQMIPVVSYTNADAVELFLNGKPLGRKTRWSEPVEIPVGTNVSASLKFRSKYRLMWQVPYEPGEIRAVAYKGKDSVASKSIRTAGAPAQIRLIPDRSHIAADGEDLSFVTVRIEDKDGTLCPLADNLVKFKVEGAGRIVAVDNGNAASTESFQADSRRTFSGQALLIVGSRKGQPGPIRVAAESQGLDSAATEIASGEVK